MQALQDHDARHAAGGFTYHATRRGGAIPFNRFTVLVLNMDGQPIGFPPRRVTAAEAILGVLTDKFRPVALSNVVAHAATVEMVVPSVVMNTTMVPEGRPHQVAGLTARNLFVRDQRRCVYTNRELHIEHPQAHLRASVDHVFPKSKVETPADANTWENWVLAAAKRNSDKTDRVLKQVEKRMRIRPWVPRLSDLLWLWLNDPHVQIQDDWRDFLTVPCSDQLQEVLAQDRRWRG